MSITRPDVEHVARLAAIALTEEEVDATLVQLQDIFSLIEKMQSIDTRDLAPLITPLSAISDVTVRMREDRVTEENRRDELMAAAPAVADGLFLVPRVVD